MFLQYNATFSLIEWLAVTGLVQSVVILVYIGLRVRYWRQTFVAMSYFLFLALSFALQFALRLEDLSYGIQLGLWFSRSMLPPLCYLLVVQIISNQLPDKKHFLILLTVPVFITAGFFMNFAMLYWLSAMAGTLCMMAIWCRRDIFGTLRKMKGGRERYWLVIMIVITNLLGVAVTLFRSIGYLDEPEMNALMVALGIAFAYLATTTLFRVYPQPIQLDTVPRTTALPLSAEERTMAEKVKKLMELEKLYHEPTFSRADLAREVGASESILSRVINTAFGKSFPRMLSEYRVEDAKRMLADSQIPIQVIAFEVGFNSLASFNRVFKEVTGEAPSTFRIRQLPP